MKIRQLQKIEAELRFMQIRIPDLHLRAKVVGDNITELDLSNVELDQFPHFPISISNLPKITHLDLSSNYLSTFPEELLEMKQLQFLDISHNEIERFPPGIDQLTQLVELRAKNNRIGEIHRLPVNLRRLNLSQNELQTFPQIKDFDLLHSISLAQNNIKEIRENHLPDQLRYVNLRSNRVEKLPTSMNDSRLEKLNLYNNPLNAKELEKVADNVRLFLDHRISRKRPHQKILRPRIIDLRFERFYPPQFGLAMSAIPFTPVMIYGAEFVGKRWLLDTYIHEQHIADNELSIIKNRYQNWEHYILKKNRRYFQIWYPFQQDINDPNYRTGITNGFYYASVFLLVFDVTEDKTYNTVENAIRRISSFRSYHTPIMIIGNKIDLRGPDHVSRDDIQKKINTLEDKLGRKLLYFETSVELGINVSEVFEALFQIYST